MYRRGMKIPRLFPPLPALALLALLTLTSSALAQFAAPSISLNSVELAPGETLRFVARQLSPNSNYTLRLEGPTGQRLGGTLVSDANGTLRYEAQLEVLGAWTLRFDGENVSVLLGVEVVEGAVSTPPPPSRGGATTPAEPEPAQEPPAEAAPAEPEPAGEPEPTTAEPAVREPVEPGSVEPPPADLEPTEPIAPPPSETVRPDAGVLVDPGVDFVVQGDELVAQVRDGTELWRYTPPGDTGPLSTDAVLIDETVVVGKGLDLLELDALTGAVLERHRFPDRVATLVVADAVVTGTSLAQDARSSDPDTLQAEGPAFVLRDGALSWQDEALEARDPLALRPYPADPAVFGWLQREADVADPRDHLERDPTNPFLHLRYGESLDSDGARLDAFAEALTRAETFFEYAQLARGLFEAGAPELANEAMEAALADFAARGYDPRLLTDLDLRAAYGFPLRRFEAALARGGITEARFWAPWVYATASDSVPATEDALREFSRQLRSAGDRDGANLWRARSDLAGPGGLLPLVNRLFESLGRVGWYAVASLLIAIVALHLTLIAKYWRPQAVLSRERRGGKPASPASHLLAIRYYSFVEKVVLVLLFAAAFALAGLAIWQDDGGADLPELSRGVLSDLSPTVLASDRLRDPTDPLGRFVVGVIAQSQGELERAETAYRQAGDFAPALNNLAALTGDTDLYERALERDPRSLEARFNSGRVDDPLPFHATTGPDTPLLALPTSDDLHTLLVGSWQDALARTFSDPWTTFRDARAPGLQAAWLWWTALGLVALAAVVTLLWLAVPRPRLARNAPRTILYQVLALLLPGSGLADELWGLLLLIPWAIFGLDALANYFGWGFGLGFGFGLDLVVLGGLYLINTIAFIVELGSYNRRMRELKRRDPETALRFGMRGVRDAVQEEPSS
jgi:tetratricopeptide (TPR) repeat protein